jgi:hypothetical protein
MYFVSTVLNMAFKRKYTIEDIDEKLFVKVLVACSNCGSKDTLDESGDICHVKNGFINSTDIKKHGDCSICGENAWEEIGECIKISKPRPKSNYDYKIKTLKNIIEYNEILMAKYKKAKELNFYITDILNDDGTLVLHKTV